MYRPSDHRCYVRPDTTSPKTEGVLFIFYDLETRQETPIEGTPYTLHEPNLCIFQYKCSKCLETEKYDSCFGAVKILTNEPVKRFRNLF